MRLAAASSWHTPDWERFVARFILFAWAAFWIWFGLASGLAEHLPPMGVFIHMAAPGLVFAIIAVLAWRFERAAGWVLLVLAALILLAYDDLMGHRGIWFVLQVGSILAGPPALAGILFLLAARSR
jgi:hypothetical protein